MSRTITPDPCAVRVRGASRTPPEAAGHLPGIVVVVRFPPTGAAATTAAINPATEHARTCVDGGVNGPARAAGRVRGATMKRRATGVDDKFNAIFTDARARRFLVCVYNNM